MHRLTLKRTEELVRICNAAARVAEPDDHTLALAHGGDREFADRFAGHRPFAVAREIQQHLQQALAVRPDHRKRGFHVDR